MLLDFPGHLPVAGLCLFLSAVFDCADGQLARMRGTSSVFGRMLDGVADLVVAIAAVGGSIWVIWSKYNQPTWLGFVVLGLCVATAVTGSFHTGMYDHFKNVFLRLTSERYTEGESYARARARYESGHNRDSLAARLAWPVYLFYTKNQEQVRSRLRSLHADPLRAFAGVRSGARRDLPRRGRPADAHLAPLVRLWLAGVRDRGCVSR